MKTRINSFYICCFVIYVFNVPSIAAIGLHSGVNVDNGGQVKITSNSSSIISTVISTGETGVYGAAGNIGIYGEAVNGVGIEGGSTSFGGCAGSFESMNSAGWAGVFLGGKGINIDSGLSAANNIFRINQNGEVFALNLPVVKDNVFALPDYGDFGCGFTYNKVPLLNWEYTDPMLFKFDSPTYGYLFVKYNGRITDNYGIADYGRYFLWKIGIRKDISQPVSYDNFIPGDSESSLGCSTPITEVLPVGPGAVQIVFFHKPDPNNLPPDALDGNWLKVLGNIDVTYIPQHYP